MGLLINKTGVAKEVRKHGGRASQPFIASLDAKVAQLVKDAAMRAKSNGRKTVMPCDA